MKRLVLLVEGQGDVAACPSLVGELLTKLPENLQGQLFLDNAPMKIGGVHQITGSRQADLVRHLGNANKRPKLGAALLILDGDAERVEGQPFCPVETARVLAQRAVGAGAGSTFSFAAVFLRQEFESLFIALASQLPELKAVAEPPAQPEESPRDAKGWLHDNLTNGYNPTQHQLELTRAVRDWVPAAQLRSFRRLESALAQLAMAIASGQHITSPCPPTTGEL